MFCSPCEYKNIKHIIYHNTIVDNCKECNICSILLSDYDKLITNIILEYKIGGLIRLSNFSELNKSNKKKIEKFLFLFKINFKKLKKLTYKCNTCESDLTEFYLDKDTKIYICMDCMRVYFYMNELDEYLNKVLKKCNKGYFNFIKRFLQKLKWSKNNVKK